MTTHQEVVNGIENLTDGERKVLAACLFNAEGNGYDFGFGDQVKVSGMDSRSVIGTLGSLVQKGHIYGECPVFNGRRLPTIQFELSGEIRALLGLDY